MTIRGVVFALALAVLASGASAQLPADAVILGKVKILEKQKSTDLCPVHLVPSDPKLPAWKHNGFVYHGHTSDCQAEFDKDPEKFASAAKFQRWENNFCQAMSIIWCPVTDEVNPGGGKEWVRLGLKWESCCQFCDEDFSEEDFPDALVLLKGRAKEAYEASGGKYVAKATSPVEGAIKILGVTEFVGTWNLKLTTPGGRVIERKLTFEAQGDQLSGTVSGRQNDVALEEIDTDEEGTFSFRVVRKRDGQEFVAQYSGQLEGDKLVGKLNAKRKGKAFEIEFTATREKEKK